MRVICKCLVTKFPRDWILSLVGLVRVSLPHALVKQRVFLVQPTYRSRGSIFFGPMVASPHENVLSLGPYTEASAPSKSSTLFPVFSPFANGYSRFSSWRAALGLPNPGSVENLQKEVKSELSPDCRSVRAVSDRVTQ